MTSTLTVGILLATGFLVAEAVVRLGFPKVTGYILAGIILNPKFNPWIPTGVFSQGRVITDICLAFITFSVGGSILLSEIKGLGKTILTITVLEAETAALFVALAFALIGPHIMDLPAGPWRAVALPMGLLMAALASPTDPSATLAVVHEYKAKGPVTETILGVTALDDVTGIINYSLASAAALVLVARTPFSFMHSVGRPLVAIFGAVALGAAAGVVLAVIARYVLRKETEGALIVVIFAVLGLTFGSAKHLDLDELLATMTMGAVVTNISRQGPKIFQMLERYTEELVFVLFFTMSGMLLDLQVLLKSWPLAVLFVLVRAVGKGMGAYFGASISNASPVVRRYTAGGLIPQGGIVIGLALLLHETPAFSAFSDIIMNVVLGATVLHELLGPVASKFALSRAGEIGQKEADTVPS